MVAAAVVAPEAVAVAGSFYTGVKTGEAITGVTITGTPLTADERAAAAAEALVGWASIAATPLLLAKPGAATTIGTATRTTRMRVSPFNQAAGEAGLQNCVRCVTSLVDAIENEGFVLPALQYPARASFPTVSSALEYITAQTGVTFGKRLRGTFGGPGDYAVFNQFKDGRPSHVLWARVRADGTSYFYDPQIARKVNAKDVGKFEAYQIVSAE
jgi:hypothetical protein